MPEPTTTQPAEPTIASNNVLNLEQRIEILRSRVARLNRRINQHRRFYRSRNLIPYSTYMRLVDSSIGASGIPLAKRSLVRDAATQAYKQAMAAKLYRSAIEMIAEATREVMEGRGEVKISRLARTSHVIGARGASGAEGKDSKGQIVGSGEG